MAGATIVLGIIRGTVLGDIKSVDDLGSAYGIYWLVGLVAALATFAWGSYSRTQRKRFAAASAGWAGTGEMPADLAAERDRIRLMALIELVGFLVAFTTMVLMHYAGEA